MIQPRASSMIFLSIMLFISDDAVFGDAQLCSTMVRFATCMPSTDYRTEELQSGSHVFKLCFGLGGVLTVRTVEFLLNIPC